MTVVKMKDMRIEAEWNNISRVRGLEHPGYIYFIGHRSFGPVKIGWSKKNPRGRLVDFQIGNPLELVILWTMPGSLADEDRLQRSMAHYRVRGEWFKREATDALLAAYGAVRALSLVANPVAAENENGDLRGEIAA